MSIADELRDAERDVALSFSPDAWRKAVIEAWKSHKSTGVAMIIAANMSRAMTDDEWLAVRKRCSVIHPRIPQGARSVSVRGWLGSTHRVASDLLFDGKFGMALKALGVPGTPAAKQPRQRRVARLFVAARELDKSHDWSTCK